MLLLLNATNYMDGMDGLISLLSIFIFVGMLAFIPKDEWNLLISLICFNCISFNFGMLPSNFR